MKKTITIKNKLSELEIIRTEIDALLLKKLIPQNIINEIQLITEEIVNNIISYAYDTHSEDSITLNISILHNNIEIEFLDSGIPFNPLDRPDKDLFNHYKNAANGGLGIFFAKKFADQIAYKNDNGLNCLKIIKNIE